MDIRTIEVGDLVADLPKINELHIILFPTVLSEYRSDLDGRRTEQLWSLSKGANSLEPFPIDRALEGEEINARAVWKLTPPQGNWLLRLVCTGVSQLKSTTVQNAQPGSRWMPYWGIVRVDGAAPTREDGELYAQAKQLYLYYVGMTGEEAAAVEESLKELMASRYADESE